HKSFTDLVVDAYGGPQAQAVAVGHKQITAAFKAGQGSSAGGVGHEEEVSPTLTAASDGNRTPAALQAALTWRESGFAHFVQEDVAATLRAEGAQKPSSAVIAEAEETSNNLTIRRLTPIECERLQGFPDGWTQIPWRNQPAEDC